MFQDTADMQGMGNDLDRSKEKLEEQEILLCPGWRMNWIA